MSYMINGKQHISSAKGMVPSRDVLWSEPPPLEKINWLIHLQHVRGEIRSCTDLIQEDIKRTNRKNHFAYYQQGILQMEDGKLKEALDSFQTCYKLNPKYVENIKCIGTCLYLLRRYKLATEAYFEAEKCSEKPDWEIAHRLSECLLSVGDVETAKDYSRRAVQLGKQEMSYALLIKILVETNDLRSAVAVSNAALECYPESPNMLTESAILHLRTGQTAQAFERLTAVLNIEPTAPKALLAAGCIIQNAGDHDGALAKYKLAVSSIPDSVPLWNNIGLSFCGKQKFVAAMGCLKRALWMSPLNWRVLYNLGLVHLSIGQSASAFNSLCATVNIRPDNGLAFILLACSLLDLKDSENAARAAKQALILSPEDPIVLSNASLCGLLAGQNELAVEAYKSLHRILENNPSVPNEVVDLASKLKLELKIESFEEANLSENGEGQEHVATVESDENNLKEMSTRRELAPDEV